MEASAARARAAVAAKQQPAKGKAAKAAAKRRPSGKRPARPAVAATLELLILGATGGLAAAVVGAGDKMADAKRSVGAAAIALLDKVMPPMKP
jgi:hypothetical protein